MLLYYISDRHGFAGDEAERRAALLLRLAEAARAGVDYIQLREKDLPRSEFEILAQQALGTVRRNSDQTKLLLNTYADIALAVGADGVHLPAGSVSPTALRVPWRLRSDRDPTIGVSAHNVEDVRRSEAEGASLAVLAPIFEKAAASAQGIGLDVLRRACTGSRMPVLALGGVTLLNARECLDAGAAGVAGIRLFQQGDVAETVRRLRAL